MLSTSSNPSAQGDDLSTGLRLAPCLRPLTSPCFGGFLLRLNAFHVPCTPFAKWSERIRERVAELCESILDSWRNFPEIPSRHDAVCFHFLQMLDQHLLADPLNHASQFSETPRLRPQRPQNQPLPFPAHDVERGVEAAKIGPVSHAEYSWLKSVHTYGQVSTCRVEIQIDIGRAANFCDRVKF